MKKNSTPPKKASKEAAQLPAESPKPEPAVVGIGASAGGLVALKTFFEHVPSDSGLAFVVVVHLSPEHKSHLADLLQPHVKMPVQQVTETVALKANNVYVIPPNANLNTIDTHLRLSELEERRRERAPIDHFFRTLASTHDGQSIGVVLTGTGSDGTLGIKDIKAKGGFVVVQDPNEAEYDGMPQSAIATGLADFVLPVANMPETILRFAFTRPRVPTIPESVGDVAADEERTLHKIFAQLRARTDRDFSRYKRSTILRRIARRMQLNYLEDLSGYLDKLRQDAQEVHALSDDLLITVTHFFRDTEVFEKLEKEVVPGLFDNKKNSGDPIRVWSVGCATGEEAYSMAIVLMEEAERREAPPDFQVFASDLHEHSLQRAREGFYPGDIAADVSAPRLKRFFHKEDGGYRIRKEIRELVVFAPHNLLGDPPFSRIHLISCRNLLIYLQREVQNDVIDLFHYALRPNGWLLLGSAETIEASDLFSTEEKKLCIYRKRNVQAPEPRLPVFLLARPNAAGSRTAETDGQSISTGAVLQRMMERYAPASLLISRDNKLAQIAGNAGRYLVHPSGEPTNNIFRLVREELRVELQAAVQTVRNHAQPFDSKPIPVRFNGDAHPVVLRARAGTEPTEDGFVLVIFEEQEPVTPTVAGNASAEGKSKRSTELESDLHTARQQLQSIVEEYETSQEEMKASNEEMQSINEELRSTMEELETSKEELQSINEELQTVNQENRHKVEELAQLASDLQNLLAATDIATLFLDRELRILRFTPKIGELFNVKTTDRGRQLTDLTHRLGYPELESDAKAVLNRLMPVEREVRDEAGQHYLTRVLPYRSTSDQIEGVVITFVDISRRLEAERDLRESEERYRLLVNNAREYAIFLVDPDGTIASWNMGAQRIFGYDEKEILGRSLSILYTEEDRAAGLVEQKMKTAATEGKTSDDRWRLRKDGTRFWASGAMEALFSPDGTLRAFAKVLRDNTDRKQAQEAERALAETLEVRVEERTLEVRELSAQLTMAEHGERDRIAQILHDDLQQMLYSIQMKLVFLREGLEAGEPKKGLIKRAAKAEEELGQGIRTTQHLAIDLSPQVLEQEGLLEMLCWLADHMNGLHQMQIVIESKGSLSAPKPVRILLFQAVRELLFNVVKHAGVKQATVALTQSGGELLIRVIDQGDGFDVDHIASSARFGIASIRQRLSLIGGRMKIDSRRGEGTTMTMFVPVEVTEAAEDTSAA